MAVPYRPPTASSEFALYRPQFIEVTGFYDPDYAIVADAFFKGVAG